MSSVGLLLLLDDGGSVDLTGGWLAAVICAAVGRDPGGLRARQSRPLSVTIRP